MTEQVFAEMMAKPDSGFDAMEPGERVAACRVAGQPTGAARYRPRVRGRGAASSPLADGWRHGPRADKGARWDPAEIGAVVDKLIAAGPPPDPVYGAPR